jgi:hypothetical protein
MNKPENYWECRPGIWPSQLMRMCSRFWVNLMRITGLCSHAPCGQFENKEMSLYGGMRDCPGQMYVNVEYRFLQVGEMQKRYGRDITLNTKLRKTPFGQNQVKVTWSNADASFSRTSNKVGIGVCIRDEQGQFVLAKHNGTHLSLMLTPERL